MKYVVASLGAALVFIGTFIVAAVLLGFVLPPMCLWPIQIGPVYTDNPTAFIIAMLAATHSFRATLKRHST